MTTATNDGQYADQYLSWTAPYERLEREYLKHGNLVVGVDFDGTVNDYHKTGATHELVRQLLRDLKEIGCRIIFWTCYRDHSYVWHFCKQNNLPCDDINTDGIPLPYESRKPFFNALLDDRAGLRSVWQDLTLLVHKVKTGEIKYESDKTTN